MVSTSLAKFVPFRTKLIRFGLLLVIITAFPFLYSEARRPWDSLRTLSDNAKGVLSGVVASLNRDELVRMNRFAEDVIEMYVNDFDELPDAHYQAFNMLLDHRSMLSKEKVERAFAEEGLDFTGDRYLELKKSFAVWEREFSKRPGLLETFRKYRNILIDAKELAAESGVKVSDIYIMFDQGSQGEGYFKNHLAYILDSYHWVEGSFAGEPYDMQENDTFDWRESYEEASGGAPGFHSNKLYDPANWYLPQIDTDEWGSWFSVWYAIKSDTSEGVHYNTVNIDLEASAVYKMMARIAFVSLFSAAVIATMVMFVASRISRRLSQPIEALIQGSEAVMSNRTDYIVPIFANDEFKRLIEVFNQLVKWVHERINMKDTLTKLLSEELADKAAQEGLVLGGEQVECSVLFTDFAGFSSITSGMHAKEVVELLNYYFSELIPVIKQHGGFPDKYIGDAIVAIFGAPVHFTDHAERAVRCAIEMQKTIRRINDIRRAENRPLFEMRIGINSGPVVAGAIGCDLKLEYTSIGDTTNLAQRMETACQIGHLLIAENTYKMIRESQFDATVEHKPKSIQVKGLVSPINAYSIQCNALTITKNAGSSPGENSFYSYREN